MSRAWRVSGTVHEVRFGARLYRVFRVGWSSPRVTLAEAHPGWAYDMYADRAAARDLVGAWCLAARSPHSLIWLPMRANKPPRGLTIDGVARPLDLVLVRSEVQFAAHEWKRVRAALGPGRRTTARVPRHEFANRDDVDWEATDFRESRNHLRFDNAAETLFVASTRTGFDLAGTQLTGLETDAPRYAVQHPDYHYCAEVGVSWRVSAGHTRRIGPGDIHIQYCPGWDLSRPDPATGTATVKG